MRGVLISRCCERRTSLFQSVSTPAWNWFPATLSWRFVSFLALAHQYTQFIFTATIERHVGFGDVARAPPGARFDRTRSSHASTRSSRSGKTKLLPASRPRFIQSIVGTTALSSIIRIVACERTSIIDSRGNNQPRTSTTSRFVLF